MNWRQALILASGLGACTLALQRIVLGHDSKAVSSDTSKNNDSIGIEIISPFGGDPPPGMSPEVWKQIRAEAQAQEQKAQEKALSDWEDKLNQLSPTERKELEAELQREKEAQFKPETRTEAEIELEEQHVLELFETMQTDD